MTMHDQHVHTRFHDSTEGAAWVDQTLLGWEPYLKGQIDSDQTLLGRTLYLQERSDLQGKLGFAFIGCSVSPAEQDGWTTVVHQCSVQPQSMEQCCL